VNASGGVASQKAWYIATHSGDINWAAVAVGISALLVLFGLARTRFALFGSLVAVVVPTAIGALLRNTSVATVSDEGAIPTGLPPLALPHLSDLSIGVVTGALAIAAIALVQGAGVAESAPNPDGSPSHTNGDFIGQGVGNLLSGLFHGTPVGGSVGSTALNVSAGARSRRSSVFAGLWMLVILVALSGLVGAVAMPTLGAVLIFAAVKSLRPGEIAVVWKTAHTGKIALLVTFGATLALPVAAAVGVGVFCSLLLQLNKELMELRVVQLEPTGDGRLLEHPPPATLPDDRPVVLDVYGSLLYAGARTLGTKLPDPRGAHHPVVVLRLRGRTSLGSTFFGVTAGYAQQLAASGGRLYLSGVEPEMMAQFHHAQVKDNAGTVKVFQATEVLGESTIEAVADARTWLVGQAGDPP
jgi:SulP family sulfate permease